MNRTYTNRRILGRGLLLSIGGVLLANAAGAQSSAPPADREALKRQLQEMNLSPEQAENALTRRLELMQKADANNDGVLTKAELQKALESQFARLDRNNDGVASANDTPKFAGRNRFESLLSQLMARQDADGDGKLSFAEFSARPLSGFASIDDDGDGQIDLDTIAASFEANLAEGEG